MAKAQLPKSKLANIENEFDPNTLVRTAIFKVIWNSGAGVIDSDNPYGIFLLNPDSFEESKSSNWAIQNIPGQSDPIYQWVSGGPRVIRFDALITRENSQTNPDNIVKKDNDSAKNIITNLAAPIAQTISKTTSLISNAKDTISSITGTFESKKLKPTMSIDNELNYYRSLLYPIYKNNILRSSPPLIALYTGRALNREAYGAKVDKNSELWIVTNLKIKHTKFLPDMSPMEAIVSFELSQYTINTVNQTDFKV